MCLRLWWQSILAHRCDRHPEGIGDLLVRYAVPKSIHSVTKIHVCSRLDVLYAVDYTSRDGAR